MVFSSVEKTDIFLGNKLEIFKENNGHMLIHRTRGSLRDSVQKTFVKKEMLDEVD